MKSSRRTRTALGLLSAAAALLLLGASTAGANTSVSASAGVVRVVGDSANNTIQVKKDPNLRIGASNGAWVVTELNDASGSVVVPASGCIRVTYPNDPRSNVACPKMPTITIALGEGRNRNEFPENGASAVDASVVVTGGSQNDKLRGSLANSWLVGLGGNDTLTGGGSADQILGGPGSDTLAGGAGNDTIKGQEGSDTIAGGSGIDSCAGGPEPTPESDTIRQCDPKIKLSWEAIGGAVDANPNPGGGLRIFPDKKTPTDTVARGLVRVKVTTDPPADDHQIQIKSFDVDDPSGDTTIDPNGALGSDNLVRVPTIGPLEGTLSTQTVRTDASGTATATLDLTNVSQPGNNFKIAASGDGLLLAIVTESEVGDGNVPLGVSVSPMLTVWRHLNLELDTMAAPGLANTITGRIVSVTSGTGCLVKIDKQLEERNQYQRTNVDDPPQLSALTVGGVHYPVAYNDIAAPNSSVAVAAVGGKCPASGAAYSLHDDDHDDLLPRPVDNSFLQDSDDPSLNRIGAAYVRPVIVNDPTDYVPFQVHGGSEFDTSRFDGLGKNSQDYWVSYVVNGLQSWVRGDNDPDSEQAVVMGSTRDNSNLTMIYLEGIRDYCDRALQALKSAPEIVLHEVGHQLGVPHGDGGVMDYPSGARCTPAGYYFTPKSLRRIRAIVRPGG